MLALCTSPNEISLVLAPSDARWLSEEMSFLAELYRSKAGSSERQFGGDYNPALASFWETALKCQRLSVALQQAVRRGPHTSGAGRDQPINVSPATDPPHPVSALPSPEAQATCTFVWACLYFAPTADIGCAGFMRPVAGFRRLSINRRVAEVVTL